ncbi:hypothetical protein AHF37_04273 [Paragonimus kellicotti]|nr:hypothetical protein AHF37_04273 [Paragonimus kellicotti]
MTGINAGQSYLLGYNSLQLLGWSFLLYTYVSESYQSGKWLVYSPHAEFLLRIFQTLGLLEILHASVRLVKSSPVTTALQLFSRVFVVWGILFLIPTVKYSTIAVPLILVSWCCAEILRYVFYALHICNSLPQAIIWLRYSAFMLLYPTGITGELIFMYRAVQHLHQRSLYKLAMPNVWNISLDYKWFVIAVLLSYIPFAPKLYLYMLSQRRKTLKQKAAIKLRAVQLLYLYSFNSPQ